MTFSIVARAETPGSEPEWGVAVASKFLGVGSAVPWARAPVGAVATQALANLSYGSRGLDLLAESRSAQEVVDLLTGPDADREQRQVGIVDAAGEAATFTGSECFDWAGGRVGPGYCCQGNILTGPDVIEAMAEAFDGASGALTDRLLAALDAGDAAGGDRRGRQSACLLVVRAGAGYGGTTDRAVDLRVDDHPTPVRELARLLDLHRLYFPRPEDLRFVPIDDAVALRVRSALAERRYDVAPTGPYDPGLRAALWAYVGTENLEERWTEDERIERAVLHHLTGWSGP